jgi:hypothetical protein
VDEKFGYGSLSTQFIEDEGLDPDEIASRNGWICRKGFLCVSFFPHQNISKCQFGHKPDKETMRRMYNDNQKAIEAKNAAQT